MHRPVQSVLARLVVVSLLLWISPAEAMAQGRTAGLEGRLLEATGRPAVGYRVHLIDAEGRDLAQAPTDGSGLYAFELVTAGTYSMGIEDPQGRVAPVTGPPVRMGGGELARRDLKLLEAEESSTRQALQANYSLDVWWAGLSPSAKAWTIVAVIVAAGITWTALDDDEPQASPF